MKKWVIIGIACCILCCMDACGRQYSKEEPTTQAHQMEEVVATVTSLPKNTEQDRDRGPEYSIYISCVGYGSCRKTAERKGKGERWGKDIGSTCRGWCFLPDLSDGKRKCRSSRKSGDRRMAGSVTAMMLGEAEDNRKEWFIYSRVDPF